MFYLHVRQDFKSGGSGTDVRSGSTYYNKWDDFAKQADGKDDEEAADVKPAANKGSVADVVRAAAAAGDNSSSSSSSGPQLTQQQMHANAALSEEERAWNSEQERVKGNDCFR